MLYGSEPEAHIQFNLHVDSDVFDKFTSNCIEVDYGNDELYVAENDCFVVRLFSTIQRRRLNLLSLVEQSFLNLLIRLYKGDLPYKYVHDFVMKVCYRPSVFSSLSVYIFQNMFKLVTKYFGRDSFDEIYCILFTCITLSDVNFTRGDGVLSTVYYYYSVYCIIACAGNNALRVVQENKGVQIAQDWRIANKQFGLHMRPFGPEFNNFLEIRHNYLTEEMLCSRTNLSCSCVNLSIIRASVRVNLILCSHFV